VSNGGWRRFGTIRVKILVPVAVILLLLFVLLSTYTGRLASDEAHLNLATKAKSVATIASHALGEGLEYADVAAPT
jgi:hypothetical protein